MRVVIAVTLFLLGCGRSTLGGVPPLAAPEPAPSEPPPATQRTELQGHWASFVLGNCINDEAWLSFDGESDLTVTSVNRNFCGPHSLESARGTFTNQGERLALSWAPSAGDRALTTSYALRPREDAPWAPEPSYRLGTRELVTAVWHPSAGGFIRFFEERFVENGERYLRRTSAQVSFDVPVATALGPCVATLAWQSQVDWGSRPTARLDEVFDLPCRVKEEDGRRTVTAVALDEYDGFWRILVARGLDRSYGWDLDRLAADFGPSWVLGADGLLFQRATPYAPTYLELLSAPPTEP